MSSFHKRLPLLLALVAVLFFSAPLVAQDRRDYGDRRYDNAQSRAFDEGYRRGQDRGRDDARHDRTFDYRQHKEYRNADDGYNRRYGDRGWYRDEFRRGFTAGYMRAFQAFAPRGYYDRRDRDGYTYGSTYPGYDQRALPRAYGYGTNAGYDKGYRDGLDKGRDDARHDRRFEPARHDWYRDGDRGYKDKFGPRGEYAAAYRQGFMSGYSAAYGGRRY